MCTTIYSQALDATETTTTIETMGGIEFRDGNKRPATYAQNGRKIDVLRNKAKVEKDPDRMETKGALQRNWTIEEWREKGSARASLKTYSE